MIPVYTIAPQSDLIAVSETLRLKIQSIPTGNCSAWFAAPRPAPTLYLCLGPRFLWSSDCRPRKNTYTQLVHAKPVVAWRWTSVLCDLFQRSLSNCTSQSELLILLAIAKNALRLTAPSLEWALTIQNVYQAESNRAFTCVKCVAPARSGKRTPFAVYMRTGNIL